MMNKRNMLLIKPVCFMFVYILAINFSYPYNIIVQSGLFGYVLATENNLELKNFDKNERKKI